MSVNLTTIVVASALIGTGTYLFLSRSLVRALMGFLLMGNGINLLFIAASGPAGAPPIVGESDTPMTDPVPQALVLTAIVITLGMTAFVLALAHRARQLSGRDLVDDDTESARIHARADADLLDSLSARDVAEQIVTGAELPESRHHGETEADGEAGTSWRGGIPGQDPGGRPPTDDPRRGGGR
ncbi:Na(+)/H(+) antiporter subunit C [Ornithinimicrobium avium]|uniref:Na(+)/H(+) antiporter subunit C n=1 Tax=Ornithinimicrobium avium TaxID=2283195 RepID=A0A345NNY5_9MICO|nr:Na(+)/H(+) antiporter subunit C [Ornithinimicrobium avium]AXH96743.1 Na(+)/H(+) antiporter subunit C [Ornithinimicrobium avium]